MKVQITDLDNPAHCTMEQTRLSIGNGASGHALFFKSRDTSKTVMTDRESLVRLHQELGQYLENNP